jgi:hypothetical protein
MSKIQDGWRTVVDRDAVCEFGCPGLEEFPEIAALLRGAKMPAGLEWDRPPLGLRLYLEGDIAKFLFSSSKFGKALWGSVQSLEGGLLAVEEALCRGHADWRKNEGYNNGFTHKR